MVFAIGHVEGGTNAGRKRPLRDKPKPWECECRVPVVGQRVMQPAYMARCVFCKQERP